MMSEPTTPAADDLNCPSPLDCADLAEIFRIDMVAAFHRLMTLTPTQLNLQTLAYAAYLNQLHGLDLDMDDILASWQRRIKHIQRIA
jgi:hypothetical protein